MITVFLVPNMGATMGKSGNFLDALPSQGTLHVVMLGLDSAGKSTVLYRLKLDQYLNTVPTIGFNCEKVHGTVGKAKGVQFLVWDVGGQEKLRPLWRSYTRCTDGILFVVDSVDIERMEEAKMELMRTANCLENQGVPVLILANKQDLPGAQDSQELEKILGLHELIYPAMNSSCMNSSLSSSGGIACSTGSKNNSKVDCNSSKFHAHSLMPTLQDNICFSHGIGVGISSISDKLCEKFPPAVSYLADTTINTALLNNSEITQQEINCRINQGPNQKNTIGSHMTQKLIACELSLPSSMAATPDSAGAANCSIFTKKTGGTINSEMLAQFKGWFIQPTCAITGDGLQEGLEALYEMILNRRKLDKAHKRPR